MRADKDGGINMANRIPRNARKLEVEFLTDTSAGDKGLIMMAEKTDRGWIGKHNGKDWCLFVSHLRDDNACKIKVVA